MNKMSKFESYSGFLTWFMALLLSALVAGCGGGGGGQNSILGGIAVPGTTTKAITAFSLAGVTGTINEAAKTIAVTVPSGTNVKALVATFTSTGTGAAVGAVGQTSGTTPNDYTAPVAYTVIAADGSTTTYTVTVTVASITAKAITAYSFAGVTGAAGTINEAAKTIAVTVPTGTAVTALVATFTTTGTGVKVGAVAQTSGTTPNNFTAPVAYIVTAGDASTATYTVTVTVASITAKAITAYSFAGFTGAAGIINEAAKTIAVTVPNGTAVTALVATFTTTGTGVKVGTTVQTSGTTPNDFTAAVAYIVTAGDGSTATYTVTVTAASNSAKAITAYSFAGFTDAVGTIDEAAKTIAVTVPPGTSLTALVATFTTTGTAVKVGTTVQTSTATANDFTTSPVAYIVTAADGTTATYNVTVTLGAGPAPVVLGTAGNFVILTKSGITTTGVTKITGDIGVSPIDSTAITGFGLIMDSSNQFSTSSLVTGKIYAADYAVPTPANMTTAVSNMETAYTDAAGRAIPDATELGAGNISGMTIAPGLYKWTTGVSINAASTVTLSGGANEVWIFQIAGDLTVNPGASITLAGGAQAKNIFWQVGGVTGATLDTTSAFQGTILAAKAVVMKNGATLNGRALAQTNTTLIANTITAP